MNYVYQAPYHHPVLFSHWKSGKDDSVGFCDLSGENFCGNNLEDNLRGKTVCGSSFGWLIMADEGDSPTLSLLDPLTRATIQLGPIPVSFDEEDESTAIDTPNPNNNARIVYKAVLNSDPKINPLRYVVLAIYGKKKKLIYYKPAHSSWRMLKDGGSYFDDIISEKEGFYAIDEFGKIVLCNLNFSPVVGFSPSVKEISLPWFFNGDKVYLVRIGGLLCTVIRFLQNNHRVGYETYSFEVYAYDLAIEKWLQLRSIGNMAIFLGISHSVCHPVNPNNSNKMKPNSIYFTDDQVARRGRRGIVGLDNGVYDLKDFNPEGVGGMPTRYDYEDLEPWAVWFEPISYHQCFA